MGMRSETERWAVAVRAAFVAGDLGRATMIVDKAIAAVGPLDVLDKVVTPAMHDVGALWERNMITVADEHLATSTLHWLLARIAPQLERLEARSERRKVLLAAPAPEGHTTGLLMAELVLRPIGFDVRNLGGDLPVAALTTFAQRERPDVVLLGCTIPDHASALLETLQVLEATVPDAILITGGRGVPQRLLPEGVQHVRDMRHLLETVTPQIGCALA
jgi:methanogenic corrinoid protein MtbC1